MSVLHDAQVDLERYQAELTKVEQQLSANRLAEQRLITTKPLPTASFAQHHEYQHALQKLYTEYGQLNDRYYRLKRSIAHCEGLISDAHRRITLTEQKIEECEHYLLFYNQQIAKLHERIEEFRSLQNATAQELANLRTSLAMLRDEQDT